MQPFKKCEDQYAWLQPLAPELTVFDVEYYPRTVLSRIDDRWYGHCFGLCLDAFDCKPGVAEPESLGATPHEFAMTGLVFYIDPHNEVALSPQCPGLTVRPLLKHTHTGPGCAVISNLINTHTHTHTHPCRVCSEVFATSIIDPPLRGSIRVAWND